MPYPPNRGPRPLSEGSGWGPPLVLTRFPHPGHLVDALKSYEAIFYLAGSEVVLAGLFLAAANCCLRRSRRAQGGARDAEDAEAPGDAEPLRTPQPRGLEALEMLSPGAGPPEPEAEAEAEAEAGLAAGSVAQRCGVES